uniref:Uncharacterized protein n=1 Tax=viral metagenome TaxID=1070528 RepID=A0A2V0RAY9_9ZZZZ
MNGIMKPGRLHCVILSRYPLEKTYSIRGSIHVDHNLRDVSDDMIRLLTDHDVKYVSLLRDNVVEGNSWEMSAAQSLHNVPGVYSGTIIEYIPNKSITYGEVPGLQEKGRIYKELISSKNIKSLSLSR